LEAILFSLGFVRGFRYEKYRTTFRSGFEPGLITFDETPAGEFLELEGPADWIDATAVELGYSAADYITDSYAKLWLLHTGEAVLSNMVF
jgi:adenylate cyclase class IV